MKYSTLLNTTSFSALIVYSAAVFAVPATVTGLVNPESAVAHPDGRIFVTEIGEFGTPDDGKVTVIHPDGSRTTLATQLNDPKGIDLFEQHLYVTDIDQVIKVSLEGHVEVIAKAADFPGKPVFLNDIEIDGEGNLYISDSGEDDGQHAGIYRISPEGKITEIITADSELLRPNGLLMDGYQRLLIADFGTGDLYRADIASGTLTHLNSGFGQADGLVRDAQGFLYVSDWGDGRVWQLIEPKATPQLIRDDFKAAADMGLSADGRYLLVPDMQAGTLVYVPIR